MPPTCAYYRAQVFTFEYIDLSYLFGRLITNIYQKTCEVFLLKTVADYMAEALRNLGVTHSFGIIGKSICPIVLKMVDYGIEFIPGRHEASSGFEAAGYALKTGNLGVAFGTSGPGELTCLQQQHMRKLTTYLSYLLPATNPLQSLEFLNVRTPPLFWLI